MPQVYYVFLIFFPAVCVLGTAYAHREKIFRSFSKINSQTLPGGYAAAKLILDSEHLFDVRIERAGQEGHSRYSLDQKTVILSPFDYDSRSFAAIGRAQHQAGHALQHMEGNGLLFLKAFLWPWLRPCGTLALALLPLSLLRSLRGLYVWGAVLFTVYMLFASLFFFLEVNASRRVRGKLLELEALPLGELRLLERVLEAASLGCLVSLFFPFTTLRIRHAAQS